MYRNKNDKDLQLYLSKSYKNLTSIIDVLRLSLLPTPETTNYDTIEEDGVRYYLLNYERYNNVTETLKIPHLTQYIDNISNNGFLSLNKVINNIPDSKSDGLIFNYNRNQIDKFAFRNRVDIHNYQFGQGNTNGYFGYFNNYKSIVIGNDTGHSSIIEYDFINLKSYNTNLNDNFTSDENFTVDITSGKSSYKDNKNFTAYTQYIPSSIYHGVHPIFPHGIGLDANDYDNSIIKQSYIDGRKYNTYINNGHLFEINDDNDNLSLKIDRHGIANDENIIYDIKYNYFKNTKLISSSILNTSLNTCFLKSNRFKTLTYSFNNTNNDGMIMGYTSYFNEPRIHFNRNNSESYFTPYNIGFRDDELRSYFSSTYFNFNDKIKIFKIFEYDEQFSWGSYFQDTRNIYNSSKIEIGNSSELYLDFYAKAELFGSINFRSGSITHLSYSQKEISSTDDKITDGDYVFYITDDFDYNIIFVEEELCHIGDSFTIYDNRTRPAQEITFFDELNEQEIGVLKSDNNDGKSIDEQGVTFYKMHIKWVKLSNYTKEI